MAVVESTLVVVGCGTEPKVLPWLMSSVYHNGSIVINGSIVANVNILLH